MLKRRLNQGTLLILALPCTDTKGVYMTAGDLEGDFFFFGGGAFQVFLMILFSFTEV